MARVTVEDCVLKVPNRFDLVMLAAQRARDISSGAQLTLERDKDKNPVVALREIADETVDLTVLADALVKGHQRQVEFDEPEEEATDFELPEAPGELTAPVAGAEGEAADPAIAAEAGSDVQADEGAEAAAGEESGGDGAGGDDAGGDDAGGGDTGGDDADRLEAGALEEKPE